MVAVAGLSMSIMACSDSGASNKVQNLTQYDVLVSTVNQVSDNQKLIWDAIVDNNPNPEKHRYEMKNLKALNGKTLYQMGRECTNYMIPDTDLENLAVQFNTTLDKVIDEVLGDKIDQLASTVMMCVSVNTQILNQHLFVDNGDGTGYVRGNIR